MTRKALDIQRKQKILKHAEETGHVARACRYFGDAINALDQCDRDCRALKSVAGRRCWSTASSARMRKR